MELKKWEIMQAQDNGATIESTVRGDNNWRIIDNPYWVWDVYEYRIADRSADGILFQDFINELKNDCSNLTRDGGISLHSFKKEFIDSMLVNHFKTFHKYSLKKEPKYRPCENIVEGSRFIGKAIKYNHSDFRCHIQSITNEDFYLINGSRLSFGYVFENYKLKDGSPVGIKEEN